jgi:hypothetical protein
LHGYYTSVLRNLQVPFDILLQKIYLILVEMTYFWKILPDERAFLWGKMTKGIVQNSFG